MRVTISNFKSWKTRCISGFFILVFAIIGNDMKAQDVEFTQFYANKLYLNPAFAGTHNCPRVTLGYRNQWPALSGSFETQTFAYDQNFKSISGGLGLLIVNDVAAKTLRTTRVSGIYSYQFPVSRKVSVRLGLEATYFQKSIDWDKLQFGDQIHDRRGFIFPTNDVQRGDPRSGLDFSSGLLIFSENFFGGFAAHHINEPNESLIQATSQLPLKITAHAGASIPLNEGRSRKSIEDDTRIHPNILYRQQAGFQQLNIGLYVSKSVFWGGVWYRNSDSFIVVVGLQSGIAKIGYSYDVTTSTLTNQSGGSHEVSFTMDFNCKPAPKRYRTFSCPSF